MVELLISPFRVVGNPYLGITSGLLLLTCSIRRAMPYLRIDETAYLIVKVSNILIFSHR